MKINLIFVLFLLINFSSTAQAKRPKVLKTKSKVVNSRLDIAVNRTLAILKEKGLIVKY